MPKKQTFVYGKDPNPRTWHETASRLVVPKTKTKGGLAADIVKAFKEQKNGKTS